MTISVRQAAECDAELLFKWVNSPDSLAGKLLTSEPIKWSNHSRWFEKRLDSAKAHIWIIEESGTSIGQVRFEFSDGAYLVDIFLIPEARKKGNAAKAFQKCIASLQVILKSTAVLQADVKFSNSASINLFKSLGFSQEIKSEDFITLKRNITPEIVKREG
ncbi:GNAT family N-acetyltransferase [Thalassospira xiamenensis]|uniref:GNAT family N-acetyltransferase n=1 Tax=Thalassospira xiamenensis TaxID=220697 RepID=UPI0015F0D513|nr:GNAT family N-acetyltransferase [Thalassospira xiamenensis]